MLLFVKENKNLNYQKQYLQIVGKNTIYKYKWTDLVYNFDVSITQCKNEWVKSYSNLY